MINHNLGIYGWREASVASRALSTNLEGTA
jgi:hypothetical protein